MMYSTFLWRILLILSSLGLWACSHNQVQSSSALSQSSIAKNDSLENLFAWPVDRARLTQNFKLKQLGKKKKPHLGIDLAAAKDSPIYAAQDGVVIYSGKDFHGYGRMIMIEGRSGFATLYAHLSKSLIKQGTRVKKGDVIAQMGRTGRASGVHLHFEIRKDKGPVDPLLYLPQLRSTASQSQR